MQKKRNATIAKENMVWGTGAFLAVAFAVISDNAGSIIPQDMRTAMHSSRYGSTDSISLGVQVSKITDELRVLERENFQLQQRVSAVNRQGGAVSQRVASIESTMPNLLERSVAGDLVDQVFTTASIGEDQPSDSTVVRVRMVPLDPSGQTIPSESNAEDVDPEIAVMDPVTENTEQMTEIAPLSLSQFALDFGGTTTLGAGNTLWHALQSEAGTLLFGLKPLVRNDVDGDHLIVGPINDVGQVIEVCQAFAQLGYDCTPSPYIGEKLVQ